MQIETNKETASTEKNYVVHRNQLPLCCPTDDMVLWNAHPKVYLPLEKKGIVVCPYCSARYILEND